MDGVTRRLASIREVVDIQPIEKADRIEAVKVDGWWVVCQKGKHTIGESVIYFEVDSFLPVREEFEFLRKQCYREITDGTNGFKLKTVKLRNQISQGLIMGVAELGLDPDTYQVGDDLTEELGVRKWDDLIHINGLGAKKTIGRFPSFIPKTDEERIQNLPIRKLAVDTRWSVTEKLDGSSGTFFVRDGKFGLCSRNLELDKEEASVWGAVAQRYNLEERMLALDRNIAIQGEVVGPKCNGNVYQFNDVRLYVFRMLELNDDGPATDIDIFGEGSFILEKLGLEHVPYEQEKYLITEDTTRDELLAYADGKSKVNPAKNREGVVFHQTTHGTRYSFKVVSNKYLLRQRD